MAPPSPQRSSGTGASAGWGRGGGKGSIVSSAVSGMPAADLPLAQWRKSRHSNPSGNCVEVAWLPAGQVAVRNSRFPAGPALVFTHGQWAAFLDLARDWPA
jgi:hypothetical protein